MGRGSFGLPLGDTQQDTVFPMMHRAQCRAPKPSSRVIHTACAPDSSGSSKGPVRRGLDTGEIRVGAR